jgi:F-type H+-transporting ATPase subunit a
MEISPDNIVILKLGPLPISMTIIFTWVVMAILVLGSLVLTRKLTGGLGISRGQNFLEVIILGIMGQIREVSQQVPDRYLPFIGTLFLFIVTSNILSAVPGFHPPTGSLTTTAALAFCVFLSVPIYGIGQKGLKEYLKDYIKPNVFMLPFNIVGEISRTLALAVRLFGNIMSGTVIIGILLAVTPFFVPIAIQLLGLLTGVIQAYIFSILAMVYIASATRAHKEKDEG